MKRKIHFVLVVIILVSIAVVYLIKLSINSKSSAISITEKTASSKVAERKFSIRSGYTVHVYGKKKILNGKKKVPLVIFMCGTGCSTTEQVRSSGWKDLTAKGNLIVAAPEYDNASTYSETNYITSVVKRIKNDYPIDSHRIYSTGFSNGGATSVALTSTHPDLFAGIAAYGWMIDMKNINNHAKKSGMPFLVLQGTKEFIEKNKNGDPMVMADERTAIRSLMEYDKLISYKTKTDYAQTPYWGYKPDKKWTKKVDGTVWNFNNYYKKGHKHPFAQFILVKNAEHVTHKSEAYYTWKFLKHFKRVGTDIVEIK